MDVELAERELELERLWLLAKRKLERRPKAEREHGKENVEEKAEEEKRMTKDGRTTSVIDVAGAKSFKSSEENTATAAAAAEGVEDKEEERKRKRTRKENKLLKKEKFLLTKSRGCG